MRLHGSLGIAKSIVRKFERKLIVIGVFAPALVASLANAQTIKLVVPIPTGGAGDVLARVLADQITRAQNLTIVVENRPGGSTLIGTEAAARADANGNTMLIAGNGFVINPHLRKTNYHPLTSFEPICHLVNLPTVIAVNSASPYRSLADLFGAARRQPGQLTLASIGPASTAHIAFEMLKRAANVDIAFVPYPGTAPAVNALLGNHVTSYFGNYADIAGQLKSGTLRVLASASPRRIEALPDAPTLAEAGYEIALGEIWYGAVAPIGTSKQVIAKRAEWFTAALESSEVKARLVASGIYPAPICGDPYAAFLRQQTEQYGRAIRETGIKG